MIVLYVIIIIIVLVVAAALVYVFVIRPRNLTQMTFTTDPAAYPMDSMKVRPTSNSVY